VSGYSLYGLDFGADIPFTAPVPCSGASPSLCVTAGPELPPGAWEPVEVVYRSAFRDELAQPLVTLYRAPAGFRLHFPRVADFYVTPEQIHRQLLSGADPGLAEISLLGTVLAWCRESQGVPVLHAAAVGLDGGAAAFLASNRGGKTSLAASLVQAGGKLLTDDLLAAEERGSGWVGHAGYPQLRMWPDQARHFAGSVEDLPRVNPSLEKLLVPIHRLGGAFHSGPLPLRVLYLPERRADLDDDLEVRIAAAPPARALIELVRHSFLARMVEAAGLQPGRLALLARLAGAVPVRTLSYPSGVRHLPRVADTIYADLRALRTV
jgi:hypothetical protein